MSHSLPLHGAKTQLLRQLVYFDEEKTAFLDHYFPLYGKERSGVDRLLSGYVSALETIVSDFNEERLHSVVLIGSRVSIRYADDDTEESYTIVFPDRAEPGNNSISFLSPVGMQLLTRKTDETCRLAVPFGEIDVRIESIRYVNGGYREDGRAFG